MKLTWLGHASWLLEVDGQRVLLDPFFADNPAAKVSAEDFADVGHILVSHGHFDHVGDVAAVANRSGSTIVACFEVVQWFAKHHGIESVVGMNIGGSVQLPFGHVQMTPAIHSSSMPDGSYGGEPGGFVVTTKEHRVYFACDTALFSDLQLVARGGLDVAVVPIGDLYTMGPSDAIEAIRLLQPKLALPTHYGTWPPIEQDAAQWAKQVEQETGVRALAPAVGETITI